MNQGLTEEQKSFIRGEMCSGNTSYSSIARKVGCNLSSVSRLCHKEGIAKATSPRLLEHLRKKAEAERKLDLHVCRYCGKTYNRNRTRRAAGEGGKYCSRECAFADRDSWHPTCGQRKSIFRIPCSVHFNICKVCKKLFTSHPQPHATCSRRCKNTLLARKVKIRDRIKKGLHEKKRLCLVCGEEFISVSSKRSTCGQLRCQRKLYKSTRRAKKRGLPSETMTLREIYLRDGGRCQLCGRKTRLGTRHWCKAMATIDHIIPLARNGANLKKNVQLACAECNSKKAATIRGQLLLVG